MFRRTLKETVMSFPPIRQLKQERDTLKQLADLSRRLGDLEQKVADLDRARSSVAQATVASDGVISAHSRAKQEHDQV